MEQQPVEFDYRPIGTGWSYARLSVDSAVVEMRTSYLSDVLGDSLTGALLISEGETPVVFSWDEEPGEWRWTLNLVSPDRLGISVLWFEELWGRRPDADGALVIESTCDRNKFLRAVVRAARSVLNEWGMDGSRKKWVDHDFPIAELERLEQLIAT